MDRRSWPWKRKSSEKASGDSGSGNACLSDIEVKQGEQEHTKPVSFIQISLQKYEHLNAISGQVEVLNENLNDMKEKLSSAQADMISKDDLVKQHAKVAEEAISGWEKAEAEALDLKHKLESVTLLKQTAEEQTSHLESALEECMKQISSVKEESEKKLHDVVFAESKLWEKVKSDLEATIDGFEQELQKGSAEVAALSRSLQERALLLTKVNQEKSHAEAEIEVLRINIQSYERETSSLKYELNIAAKELEIRNEEKNMSEKSSEAANKRRIEDAKKITKLEAECQRLRSLVRKRLPGPAAIAQMKMEVETFGHVFGESRGRRLAGKNSSPYPFFSPEANVNEVDHYQKENEFLSSRLLTMEEESKMLKEALSQRNSELQASSSRFSTAANKLSILEAQLTVMNREKCSLKSNSDFSCKGSFNQNESRHDEIDDEGIGADSWASALISELLQLKKEKEKDSNGSKKIQNSNQLELMDDFLEMERLAGLPSETSGVDGGMDPIEYEHSKESSSVDVHVDVCKEQTPGLKQHQYVDLVVEKSQPSGKLLSMIQAQIYSMFESKLFDSNTRNLVDEIMKILQDAQIEWHHGNSYMKMENSMNQELTIAISWIHDFVVSHYKEATQGKCSELLQITAEKVEKFPDSANKPLDTNLNLDDFIISLRHLLSELRSRTWITGENCCNDCIDKATLLENGVAHHDLVEEKIPGDLDPLSPLASGSEVVEGLRNPSSESDSTPNNFSLEEFERLKMERDEMEVNFINCSENLKNTKLRLSEIELDMVDIKRQLSASQKSNDLADTQLRCMTESYKLLESNAEELKIEINLLRSKAKALEGELIAERHSHQDDLAKYNDLQEQMSMSCSKCPCHSDAATKARQDREISAAANKLAACQETINLLNKQLNSLHSPIEPTSKSHPFREEPCLVIHESPPHEYSSQFGSSDTESCPTPKPSAGANRPKRRPGSTSAPSLSSMLNDKPARGFSRFFSRGKGEF
ncbi:Filament-like plant protein 4 [Platanthera guangdongensis]|uniref:Filament-like plant protein 4 n=1 Tax=Platanthera guangdongensis TaxID=2320717 RepID=A0ABR2MLQ8_9ASPA